MLAFEIPKQEIAARLKKHRSSIYLELAHNCRPLGYLAIEEQQRAEVRRRLPRRPGKLSDPRVREYVERGLE